MLFGSGDRDLPLRGRYRSLVFSDEYTLKNIVDLFDPCTQSAQALCSPTPMKKSQQIIAVIFSLAPGTGIEPVTNRLTGGGSTAELPRNVVRHTVCPTVPYALKVSSVRNFVIIANTAEM